MDRVAVIGTGMMGPGIAACLALAGHEVCLFARTAESLERGMQAARVAVDLLHRENLVAPERVAGAADRLRWTTDLSSAVADAEFVFESIAEDLRAKQDLFKQLEGFAPR